MSREGSLTMRARGAYQDTLRAREQRNCNPPLIPASSPAFPINSSTARRCYPSRRELSWRHAASHDEAVDSIDDTRVRYCLNKGVSRGRGTQTTEWRSSRKREGNADVGGCNSARIDPPAPLGTPVRHLINPSNVCWCPGAPERLAPPWRTDDECSFFRFR